MPAKLEIRWWNGRVVGHLVNRGSNFFAYDPAWLELGHNLSPLKLPFTAAVYNAGKEEDGLPGLLADCLPDAWGRKVAELLFAATKLGPLTAVNLLAWRDSRGLGALQIHPARGDHGLPPAKVAAITAAALARGAAAINAERPESSCRNFWRAHQRAEHIPRLWCSLMTTGPSQSDRPTEWACLLCSSSICQRAEDWQHANTPTH